VRDFNTQRLIYERITVAAEALDDPTTAPRQIDHAIAECLRHKRPVYLELPRDMVHMSCGGAGHRTRSQFEHGNGADKSNPDVLKEALDEAMLRQAARPIIMAGVEIHRFGLQTPLRHLVEKTGFPIVATLLGKSVIAETHPHYLGIYEGAMGRDSVRLAVERADCVLMLGVFMTDIDFGIYSSNINVSRTINANAEHVAIQRHHFDSIVLRDFIDGLIKMDLGPQNRVKVVPKTAARPIRPQKGRPLTIRRFFARMNDFLKDDTVVVADVGDCLFGAADLTIHRKTEFIGPAYYTSMGFGVPAAIGAQIGRRHVRTVVLVGDGAFQMTGQELSTIVKYQLNPIIVVLNNKGYTTERFIQDGPYNDIHDWAYHQIPTVLQAGLGFEARTEDELENALIKAVKNTASFTIINAHFDPMDRSDALGRLAQRLARQVKKG
jgi:indolepyruvate decarboxylase